MQPLFQGFLNSSQFLFRCATYEQKFFVVLEVHQRARKLFAYHSSGEMQSERNLLHSYKWLKVVKRKFVIAGSALWHGKVGKAFLRSDEHRKMVKMQLFAFRIIKAFAV